MRLSTRVISVYVWRSAGYGISVTLFPSPKRHVLTVDLDHPSGKGISFRLAFGDRALCVRWRTLVGTGVGWIGGGNVRTLWPRGA